MSVRERCVMPESIHPKQVCRHKPGPSASRVVARVLPLLACVASGAALVAYPAQADFIVCNDSFDVLNLALARDPGGGFVSEGWWSLAPGRCAALLRGRIDSRYLYLHAIDVFNQPVLEGNVTFCISEEGFRIPGGQDCWQRGHIEAGFVEIDTGQAGQWISFLNAEGRITTQ